MSNVRVIPPPALHTINSLSICPVCKFCAGLGTHPHLCIVTGDSTKPGGRTLTSLLDQFWADADRLLAELAAHPAQPLLWTDALVPTLRPVDRSWCFCAHSTITPVAGPGGARS